MTKSLFDELWRKAVSRLPIDTEHEVVEMGWEQHVILDHENGLVYRYPRNKTAAAKLADEVQLLRELNLQSWPVEIPFLLEHTEKYSVYRLIKGDVLRPRLIARTSQEQIAQIGVDLGEFLAQLHKTDSSVVHRKNTKQTISLFQYYAGRIHGGNEAPYSKDALIDLEKLAEANHQPSVVVHGDLHGLNMVINPETKKLVGVIDFSEVEIGDPHQDFRKLFMADERLLRPSVDMYERCGGSSLMAERIKLWAFVNEWANVCYFYKNTEHPTYQRALSHLKKWGKI